MYVQIYVLFSTVFDSDLLKRIIDIDIDYRMCSITLNSIISTRCPVKKQNFTTRKISFCFFISERNIRSVRLLLYPNCILHILCLPVVGI